MVDIYQHQLITKHGRKKIQLWSMPITQRDSLWMGQYTDNSHIVYLIFLPGGLLSSLAFNFCTFINPNSFPYYFFFNNIHEIKYFKDCTMNAPENIWKGWKPIWKCLISVAENPCLVEKNAKNFNKIEKDLTKDLSRRIKPILRYSWQSL